MKRLFYFTGYRITALHWKGKQLVGSFSFEPTTIGLEKFRKYLIRSDNLSTKLLVDIIEEDFRTETIPHVGSKDRKSVIERLLDRYYRSSKSFSYSEIIGRKKSGRKDDIVLLGAMTNPKLIQPWLNLIEECGVPLSGIWTLPLVSKYLLKTIDASSGVVLVVSQQVNSNIRQTLFRNGKLVSTRTSIINQDINDISNIGELAVPEVQRTIKFLRVNNLIDSNENLDIHIIGAEEQITSLESSFKSVGREKIHVHSVPEIHKKLGISSEDKQFSGEIFTWLCLNHKITNSHYGTGELFNRYNSKLAAIALYAASLVVVIAGVLVTQANVAQAIKLEKSSDLVTLEGQEYKKLYNQRFKDFEPVFKNAEAMSSAVDLANRISTNAATSPLDFLIGLSQVLSKGGASDVSIDKIKWQAVSLDKKTKTYKKANFTGSQPVKHNAVVSGRIKSSEQNYRASIDYMQKIIKSLQENDRVESVQVLQMPVDLRSESQYTSQSGIEAMHDIALDKSGVFSFEITMKAPENV